MKYFNYLFDAKTFCATSPDKTAPDAFAMECYAESREEADQKIAKSLRIDVAALRTKACTVRELQHATTFVH